MIVLVVRDGQTVFARGYGLADVPNGVPMQTTSRVALCSLTKQFTAAAIMILEHRGELRTTDPLSRYLPEMSQTPVTIQSLLEHRSGLPDLYGHLPAGATTSDLVAAYARNDVSRVRRRPPYAYNNGGYALLGAVIERASHRSYAAFVQDNLLGPAGMHESAAAIHDAPAMTNVRTYRGGILYEAPVDGDSAGPGNIVSTAEDMGRWYGALDRGAVVPDYERRVASVANARHTAHIPVYNAGWVIGRSQSLARWTHGGSWRGAKNYVLRYPTVKLTVVLFANSYEFGAYRHRVAYEIARLFVPELALKGRPVATVDDDCVTYQVKRTSTGTLVIDGADDIRAWREGGRWMHDPWPYGSNLEPSPVAPCETGRP